jgi:membrane-bound lytic murein transglycosylase B
VCPTDRIEGTYLATDTWRMAKKPDPPKPASWNIYKIAAKAVRLGTVEAADEATAIEKAAAEFKVPANRLMAIRR